MRVVVEVARLRELYARCTHVSVPVGPVRGGRLRAHSLPRAFPYEKTAPSRTRPGSCCQYSRCGIDSTPYVAEGDQGKVGMVVVVGGVSRVE